MENPGTQASLSTVVTGSRCDARGCYEMAAWVVSFQGKEYHLCVKHTNRAMRDGERWQRKSFNLEAGKPQRKSVSTT